MGKAYGSYSALSVLESDQLTNDLEAYDEGDGQNSTFDDSAATGGGIERQDAARFHAIGQKITVDTPTKRVRSILSDNDSTPAKDMKTNRRTDQGPARTGSQKRRKISQAPYREIAPKLSHALTPEAGFVEDTTGGSTSIRASTREGSHYHTCNVTETMECRKGSDGKNTLGNACGIRMHSFILPMSRLLTENTSRTFAYQEERRLRTR